MRTSLLVDIPRTPTFDARAIAMDHVTREGLVVLEPRAAPQNRHQVFGPRADEDIGLLGIAISRQALVLLASNGGNGRIKPIATGKSSFIAANLWNFPDACPDSCTRTIRATTYAAYRCPTTMR